MQLRTTIVALVLVMIATLAGSPALADTPKVKDPDLEGVVLMHPEAGVTLVGGKVKDKEKALAKLFPAAPQANPERPKDAQPAQPSGEVGTEAAPGSPCGCYGYACGQNSRSGYNYRNYSDGRITSEPRFTSNITATCTKVNVDISGASHGVWNGRTPFYSEKGALSSTLKLDGWSISISVPAGFSVQNGTTDTASYRGEWCCNNFWSMSRNYSGFKASANNISAIHQRDDSTFRFYGVDYQVYASADL